MFVWLCIVEGTAADVVANLTGPDILRMDAIRDQESVIDYLAPEPDDAELIWHRVFVDSRTRTVFTVQQLTARTKPVSERPCVGHLKSSGKQLLFPIPIISLLINPVFLVIRVVFRGEKQGATDSLDASL